MENLQITCFKCNGKGVIPQYKWNKEGVCFTCGGDGKLDPLTSQRLVKNEKNIRSFLKHVSTRDMINALKGFTRDDFTKLSENVRSAIRRELEKRGEAIIPNEKEESPYGLIIPYVNALEKGLDKLEKEMPKPWKGRPYDKSGVVEEVSVHWLQKFQGNSLRRDDEEMDKFAKELLKDGLQDPVMVIIGQEDRRVSIGEGNHRTFAFLKAGLDKVPVRVVRNRKNPGGVFYDKMDRITQYDYVKADLNPNEVFDTYYDGDALSEFDEKALKKLGHTKVEIEGMKEWYFAPTYNRRDLHTVKEYYTKADKEVSKSVVNLLNKAIAEAKDIGMDSFDLQFAFQDYLEWISSKDGIASIDVEGVLNELNKRIDTEKYLKGVRKNNINLDDDLYDFEDLD